MTYSGHAPRASHKPARQYRIWLAACGPWQPRHVRDWPPDAVALEPAEEGPLPLAQAIRYVEAFNRIAMARHLGVWAIALPVAVCYEGDLRAGQRLARLECRNSSVHPVAVSKAGQGFGQSPHRSK